MADHPKMPPRSEEDLKKLRKLFEDGLNEAAADPEKMWELQREKDKLVEPWDRLRDKWKEIHDKMKSKKAKEAAERVATRFAAEQAKDEDESDK